MYTHSFKSDQDMMNWHDKWTRPDAWNAPEQIQTNTHVLDICVRVSFTACDCSPGADPVLAVNIVM